MPKIENKSPLTPTKVAFCITELDPGGAERALVQIVTRLDRALWTPKVYCLGPEAELVVTLREHGVEVVCYGGTKLSVFGAIRWLKRELRAFQPQVLQCFLFHANIIGRFAGTSAGVPLVLSGHRVAERGKRWHLWLDRLTKSKVDRHVAVSSQVREFIISQLELEPEQILVIPNGVDPNLANVPPATDATLRSLNIDPTRQMILAVGRLHPQKGFLDLIDAMRTVRDEIPNAQLLIVGEGPQRKELESQIAEFKLQDRITLAGYRADLTALMQRADLFVLSSHWEGMSNALLEAMAVGLPVVTTDVEGVEELIQHGENGLIVPASDVTALSNAICQMLQNPRFAVEIGGCAQMCVRENHTWTAVVAKYCKLFELETPKK